MANEKKLSPEQAALNAALVVAYLAPAKIIGRKASAIEAAKGDTWGAFKDAARIGLERADDAAVMAKGISLACAECKVPQGSVNAYLPILRKLYTEATQTDEAGRAALLSLSIKEARAKYQPPKAKAEKAKPEAGGNETADAGDGTAGDAEGIMGGTERSRILSRINAALSALSDDDLSAVLDMLESEYQLSKAA